MERHLLNWVHYLELCQSLGQGPVRISPSFNLRTEMDLVSETISSFRILDAPLFNPLKINSSLYHVISESLQSVYFLVDVTDWWNVRNHRKLNDLNKLNIKKRKEIFMRQVGSTFWKIWLILRQVSIERIISQYRATFSTILDILHDERQNSKQNLPDRLSSL